MKILLAILLFPLLLPAQTMTDSTNVILTNGDVIRFTTTHQATTYTGGDSVRFRSTATKKLGLVSPLSFPVSAVTQTALDLKSNLASPTFTGTVSGITAAMVGALGYTLNLQALTSSPADATTIYFGQLPKAPVTAAATSKIYIRKAGTIKMAQVYCFSGTAGTAEAWVMSIRLNNTTDTQIASVSLATSERIFTNSSLSIAVVAGDYIEIKCVNPTWVTNPLTTIFGGYIYIE
jgi:hypothetical protein